MIQTQIQLTDAQMAALKQIAARADLSVAEVVRRGIDRLIASEPGPTPAEQRQRARETFGRFRSGVEDLAEHHDDYLVEAADEDSSR